MRKATMNGYYAWTKEYKGCCSGVYGGYAESAERFIGLCEAAGYALDGLVVELNHANVKDEMGRPYSERVWKD